MDDSCNDRRTSMEESIESHAESTPLSEFQELLVRDYEGRQYGRFVAVEGSLPDTFVPRIHIDIDLDENDAPEEPLGLA